MSRGRAERHASIATRVVGTVLAGILGAGAIGLVPSAAGAHSAADTAPVMVVLDASGSMNTADAQGTRIAAAKRAVRSLVAAVPSDAQVGLEVYGARTSSAGAAKVAGCRDIQVVVPVATVNRTAFTSRVDAIKARGYTPIGNSLRTAAAALPKEGARSIVLVSDGEDTCAPPQPCQVAKQLKTQGVDLTVHTVGFRVDSKARAQLQCIAAATGGTYHDAQDSSSLSDQLQKQVERGLRGYRATGIPIVGGPSAAKPTAMTPGQYVDVFDRGGTNVGGPGTEKYYRIPLRAGETPYFAATMIAPAHQPEGFTTFAISVTLNSADGSSLCTSGFDQSLSLSGAVSPATAVAVGNPVKTGGCLAPGSAVVHVQRRSDAFAAEPVKIELSFRLEPPADASGLPGASPLEPFVAAPSSGAVTSIDSGSSFNDAPRLTAGRYSDTVTAGELRYVKVHVGWGQRLTYNFRFPKVAQIKGALDGVAGICELMNPVRADAYEQSGPLSNVYAFLGSTDKTIGGSAAYLARYTNRDVVTLYKGEFSIDGDYYIVLRTGFASKGSPTLPYTLSIGVVGTDERGPTYRTAGAGASSSSSPVMPTTPTGAVSTTTTPSTAVAGTSSGTSTPFVVVGAAAAVILAGLVAGLLWRRRRGSHGAGAGQPRDQT